VSEAEDGLPYTSRELAFVLRCCALAAVAIRNGQLALELTHAERFATIGQIGAGLAHDLGKPLSVVFQRAQHLLRSERLSRGVRDQVSAMAALTDEALSQIDALLERGSRQATAARAPLVDVLERAARSAERQHRADCVLLRTTPGLPDVAAPDALARALGNLIENALAASGNERIELYAAARADATEIEVIDRGPGMTPEVLRRAAQPFFTTRAASGGHGLGLSTARSLVEEMGGTLALESAPGAGTIARITLPRICEY
jgi:signal transduction histidine kinase